MTSTSQFATTYNTALSETFSRFLAADQRIGLEYGGYAIEPLKSSIDDGTIWVRDRVPLDDPKWDPTNPFDGDTYHAAGTGKSTPSGGSDDSQDNTDNPDPPTEETCLPTLSRTDCQIAMDAYTNSHKAIETWEVVFETVNLCKDRMDSPRCIEALQNNTRSTVCIPGHENYSERGCDAMHDMESRAAANFQEAKKKLKIQCCTSDSDLTAITS